MTIEGMLCELCGIYIGPGDGYPEKCKDYKNKTCKHPSEQMIFLFNGKQCGTCGKQNYGKGWV